MNVLIAADMEGIAGIEDTATASPPTPATMRAGGVR